MKEKNQEVPPVVSVNFEANFEQELETLTYLLRGHNAGYSKMTRSEIDEVLDKLIYIKNSYMSALECKTGLSFKKEFETIISCHTIPSEAFMSTFYKIQRINHMIQRIA